MSDNVLRLVPYPDSVGVQVHADPRGDFISEMFVDMNGQRVLILRDPSTAYQLGTDMLTATTDPDIAAEADRVRGRENGNAQ